MRRSYEGEPDDNYFFRLAMQSGCSVAALREEYADNEAECWSDDQAMINHEQGLPWPLLETSNA